MTTDISVTPRWDSANSKQQNGGPDLIPMDQEFDYDGGNSSSRLFERSRIRALADERETVQKKTFCKWINSHLVRANCKISDLYTDLRDGKKLIKLLEILSGERLPKPTKGKMRIHCLENVDKALQFLLREQRVHLENLGSHDIVDGNPRLTLGLIWTIILRFQIQDITIEPFDNKETKSAKDALLLWAQMKTAGYPNVNVRNFTSSWKDGLAFNAIIHKHRPDLIQYDKLSKGEPIKNLENAFQVAEEKLGLARLLDAEDVATDNPDDKSIITYVVTYYHYFSKMKAETVQGRRIGGVMTKAMENEKLIKNYEKLTSDLLAWIETKCGDLSERNFANSLDGVQAQLGHFNDYRTKEKPPKFTEKGNLEIALFTIQSQLRANNQRPYVPSDGKTINDINRAWERLERAEHERELALREEIIRQEKLKQLAWRFDKKAGMREQWLSDNQRLISKDNIGEADLASVEAASKKHEAIESDIFAYGDRVQAVVSVANELETENYHDKQRIIARKDNIIKLWNYLLDMLANRRTRLGRCLTLQDIFHEMEYLETSMADLKGKLISDDHGKHLMGVEDLLQKHGLVERDISMLGDRLQAVKGESDKFIGANEGANDLYQPFEPAKVRSMYVKLERDFNELNKQAQARRQRLEKSRQFWQFNWQGEQEQAWINEKERILSSTDIGHDLATVHMLINKNKTLEDELAAHENQFMETLKMGEDLLSSKHPNSDQIEPIINWLEKSWDRLQELQAIRTMRLNEAIDYHQFFTDADDIDAWMFDTFRLVTSKDVGVDEANADSLLRKHDKTRQELESYSKNLQNLHQQTERFSDSDRNSPLVVDRLQSIDRRYEELLALCDQRKQRLLDASALFKLFNEGNGVEQWIVEKQKMLDSMQPTQDMEDTEVLRHRFETFEQEMVNNKPRIDSFNELSKSLCAGPEPHPNARDIKQREQALNNQWNNLLQQKDVKRENIDAAHGVQTFYLDCSETVSWIDEKAKLLKETEELGNNLSGVITLQRRLGGMERDLKAIQDKLAELEAEKKRIAKEHPDEAKQVEAQIEQIKTHWLDLNNLKKDRDAKLEEAGDLHRFLSDLDHFQAWLTKTQKDIASEDIPSSLHEAEQLLDKHNQIKEEVDNYVDDHSKIMEYGDRLTRGQKDPQYVLLGQRLRALDDDWEALHKMYQNRERFLSQQHALQMFLRDSRQAEAVLNQQESYLAREEVPTSLEEAEKLIKKHEAFLTSTSANEEKLRNVDNFAQKLNNENNFANEADRDRVLSKAQAIADRRQANLNRAADLTEKLRNQLQLQQFASNCDELLEWMQEKSIVTEDESYRSAKTLHSKWTRHRAHELEIAANKDRLNRLRSEGDQVKEDQRQLSNVVDAKIDEIERLFGNLERVTQEKGQKLFDANRPLLYEQTCDAIDEWISETEPMLEAAPENDLTGVNLALAKQQNIEDQLKDRAQQVNELEDQAHHLEKIEPDKGDHIKARKIAVEERFQKLQAPIQERKQALIKKKEALQFRRDVDDERSHIADKMPLAQSKDYGNNLHDVQVLLRKNQSLQNEIDNHEPRIRSICEVGERMVRDGHEDGPEFNKLNQLLLVDWNQLKEANDNRRKQLEENEKIQQLLFDLDEAEQWLSEKELHLMSNDRGKDEFTSRNFKRKHEAIEAAIRDFAKTMEDVKKTHADLKPHDPETASVELEKVEQRVRDVEQLFSQMRDLAQEKRAHLDEGVELFKLNQEIEEVMHWISERDAAANAHELGQDIDHVTMLRERFKQFSRDTEKFGKERIEKINETADRLIMNGHTDKSMIANWKEMLDEAWNDLLEMTRTRNLELSASHQLHQFMDDCRELHAKILEKQAGLSDDLGRDADSVASSRRKHENYVNDLSQLIDSANAIAKESAELQNSYAGPKAQEIIAKEQEVASALAKLLASCEEKVKRLDETTELYRFLEMVRALQSWMEDTVRQMNTTQKPRNVRGVEKLVENHQLLKDEIVAKGPEFDKCHAFGQQLLSGNHYLGSEISEKLAQLKQKREEMNARWDERQDHLEMILEVYKFARDAAVAEAWLAAQEPYLLNQELGHSLEEVDQLIKKQDHYEKSAAEHHDKFVALQKPTTFEQRELQALEEERFRAAKQSGAASGSRSAQAAAGSPSDESAAEQSGSQLDRPTPLPKPSDISRASRPGVGVRASTRSMTAGPRSKSPFGWLRKSTRSLGGPVPEQAASPSETDSSQQIDDDDGLFKGFLTRKHTYESISKEASNRTWNKLYFVIKPGQQLSAYKDQKQYKQDKPLEASLSLSRAIVEEAKDYKKKNCFKLKLADGSEYIFKAKDDNEMFSWIDNLKTATGEPESSTMSQQSSRAQTLPPGQGTSQDKKKGFFTLKRKPQ